MNNRTELNQIKRRAIGTLIQVSFMVMALIFITHQGANDYTEIVNEVQCLSEQSQAMRVKNDILAEIIKEDLNDLQAILSTSKDIK